MYDKKVLAPYLQDIEDRLDLAEERALYKTWVAFANGEGAAEPGKAFSAPKRVPHPSKLEWPDININDALEDINLMFISQLKISSNNLAQGNGKLLNIRPNYGVGILPSLFGVKKFIMPYEMNCLPNVICFPDAEEAMERISNSPIPDLEGGFGKDVFAFGRMLKEIQADYPKIAECIQVDTPDCQGPTDVCELLLGSEMFMMMYDEPDEMKVFLQKICDTYIAFHKKWFDLFPQKGYHCVYNRLYRGSILVRNDSAMNLSPAFYEEFVLPFDNIVMQALGGGAIHFCGRGDHFIHLSAQTKECHGIDMSQPHLNDMDVILNNVIDNGLILSCVDDTWVDEFEVGKHPYNRIFLSPLSDKNRPARTMA